MTMRLPASYSGSGDGTSPRWLLGVRYEDDEEDEEAYQEDAGALLWCSYRCGFPAMEPSGLTDDSGWGCMLRAAQMLMAQGLQRHLCGRSWRLQRELPDRRKQRVYLALLTLFADVPGPLHHYSIHRMCQVGLKYDKLPGEWYGPTTACHVLKDLTEERYQLQLQLEDQRTRPTARRRRRIRGTSCRGTASKEEVVQADEDGVVVNEEEADDGVVCCDRGDVYEVTGTGKQLERGEGGAQTADDGDGGGSSDCGGGDVSNDGESQAACSSDDDDDDDCSSVVFDEEAEFGSGRMRIIVVGDTLYIDEVNDLVCGGKSSVTSSNGGGCGKDGLEREVEVNSERKHRGGGGGGGGNGAKRGLPKGKAARRTELSDDDEKGEQAAGESEAGDRERDGESGCEKVNGVHVGESPHSDNLKAGQGACTRAAGRTGSRRPGKAGTANELKATCERGVTEKEEGAVVAIDSRMKPSNGFHEHHDHHHCSSDDDDGDNDDHGGAASTERLPSPPPPPPTQSPPSPPPAFFDPLLRQPPEPPVREWTCSVILLLSVRLGLDGINSAYLAELCKTFELPQSLGFIGGRPNHAIYFVGSREARGWTGVRGSGGGGPLVERELVGLDPHTTQQALTAAQVAAGRAAPRVPSSSSSPPLAPPQLSTQTDAYPSDTYLRSLQCSSPVYVKGKDLDPSLALGFYCRDRTDFMDFVKRARQLGQPGVCPAPFSVQDSRPDYESQLNLSFAADGSDEDRMNEDSEDDDYVFV